MKLTESLKSLFIEAAKALTGSQRRLFMARTVQELGPGGQRLAQRELKWNRQTIRKETHELNTGIICWDAFARRGRKPAEARLPHFLDDIRQILLAGCATYYLHTHTGRR